MITQDEKEAIASEFRPKFTPGPWEYRWNNHFFDVGILRNDSELTIYPTVCIGVQRGLEANARLIAAAPDLYEALKDLLAYVEDGYGDDESLEGENARKAIAKAEGKI